MKRIPGVLFAAALAALPVHSSHAGGRGRSSGGNVNMVSEVNVFVDMQPIADAVQEVAERISEGQIETVERDIQKRYPEMETFGRAIGMQLGRADTRAFIRDHGRTRFQKEIEVRLFLLQSGALVAANTARAFRGEAPIENLKQALDVKQSLEPFSSKGLLKLVGAMLKDLQPGKLGDDGAYWGEDNKKHYDGERLLGQYLGNARIKEEDLFSEATLSGLSAEERKLLAEKLVTALVESLNKEGGELQQNREDIDTFDFWTLRDDPQALISHLGKIHAIEASAVSVSMYPKALSPDCVGLDASFKAIDDYIGQLYRFGGGTHQARVDAYVKELGSDSNSRFGDFIRKAGAHPLSGEVGATYSALQTAMARAQGATGSDRLDDQTWQVASAIGHLQRRKAAAKSECSSLQAQIDEGRAWSRASAFAKGQRLSAQPRGAKAQAASAR
jgi:hypothetical protein